MQEFTVTSGALPGSEKIYVKGELFNVRVPMRKIKLSDTLDADGKRIANEAVVVYRYVRFLIQTRIMPLTYAKVYPVSGKSGL